MRPRTPGVLEQLLPVLGQVGGAYLGMPRLSGLGA
jgi:hypothetical protein